MEALTKPKGPYTIKELCKTFHVTRSSYHRWKRGEKSPREQENERLAKEIERIHAEDPSKGYRRIADDLNAAAPDGKRVNDKHALRIMRKLGIQSSVKGRHNGCTRAARHPEYTAENILNRKFHADRPNEEWLTDVTEFKYTDGKEMRKLYLSAILDLFDRRIVAFQLSDRNDNPLVFDTFDKAVAENPEAHPLFHSDRGFQYTNRTFHAKLVEHGMTQSMSRVGHCIDNGPMEGFWGILKRERYYGRTFTSRDDLVQMIQCYIWYYNHKRLQRKLDVMTPWAYHEAHLAA